MENNTQTDDPRGLIQDAFRMEGIRVEECRSIFLDWALEPRNARELRAASARLLERYESTHPSHPMTAILRQSLAEMPDQPKRRGGRARSTR